LRLSRHISEQTQAVVESHSLVFDPCLTLCPIIPAIQPGLSVVFQQPLSNQTLELLKGEPARRLALFDPEHLGPLPRADGTEHVVLGGGRDPLPELRRQVALVALPFLGADPGVGDDRQRFTALRPLGDRLR
jgi:hypothetical protein